MRYLLLGCLLLCASCMHVPVATMYKMATYDSARLYTVDPQQVRYYIVIEGESVLDTSSVNLDITISDYHGDKLFANGLALESYEMIPAETEGWFPDPEKHSYVFKLSETGLASFALAQQTDPDDEDTSMNIRVRYDFETLAPDSTITLAMFFDEELGRLTVFEDAPIEFEKLLDNPDETTVE